MILYCLKVIPVGVADSRTPDWNPILEGASDNRLICERERFLILAPRCTCKCLEDINLLLGLGDGALGVGAEGVHGVENNAQQFGFFI